MPRQNGQDAESGSFAPDQPKKKITVRVFHRHFGCATGCCGHVVEITLPTGAEKERFLFEHPDLRPGKDDKRAWALECAQDAVRSEWPECYDSIDWDTIDYEGLVDD